MGEWSFFSNYGHVLVCLSRNREARLREVAQEVGITERAVQKIVSDLQAAGYLTVTKQGRCNRYHINRRKSLRHDLVAHCTVGKLLTLLTGKGAQSEQASAATPAAAAAPAAPEKPSSPAPEDKPEPAPPPERKPRPRPESSPESGPDEDEDAPADTREQGSLF